MLDIAQYKPPDNEVTVKFKASWLPELSVVSGELTCNFRGSEDADQQKQTMGEIKNSISTITKQTLHGICEDSVARKLSSQLPYKPYSSRTGSYCGLTGLQVLFTVTGIDAENLDDVWPIDSLGMFLETALFDAVRTSKTSAT